MEKGVRAFVEALWEARESEELLRWPALRVVRMLYGAVWQEIEGDEHYDPEKDLRVYWAREVIDGLQRGARRPAADVPSELVVEMLLKKGEWRGPKDEGREK